MMKKFLSILLALLMLALPVFGSAEGFLGLMSADAPAAEENIFKKYEDQGQNHSYTVSVSMDDNVYSLVGMAVGAQAGSNVNVQDLINGVKEVLSSLAIRLSTQRVDDLNQLRLDVLMNGESAADAEVASTPTGIYIASSLFGNDVLMLTNEELLQLLTQVSSESGIPDQLIGLLTGSAELPEMGEPDIASILAALAPLRDGVTKEAVTTAPEKLPDAVTVTRIPLKKEQLQKVASDLASAIWNQPALQSVLEFASSMPNANVNLSESQIREGLLKVVSVLKEDTEILVYENADSQRALVVGEIPCVAEDGVDISISLEALTNKIADTRTTDWSVGITRADSDTNAKMEGTCTKNDQGFTANTVISVDGQSMTIALQGATAGPASNRVTTGSLDFTVDANNQKNAIRLELNRVESDLVDHAEANTAITFKVTGAQMGGMTLGLTVNIAEATGLAEAYIDSPDAISITALSKDQEKMEAFGQKVQTNLQMLAISLIQKLPASLLQMLQNSGAF